MSSLADIVATLREANLLATEPVGALPAITGLTADSRRIHPGMLYCAVRGAVEDGHKYVPAALRAGAAAALVETPIPVALTQIIVTDGRRAAAKAAETWYGRPAAKLDLIGVTGTNGKSTTVTLARHVLSGVEPMGAIGTLGAVDPRGEAVESEAGNLTTPGPIDLQATLASLVDRGARGVAMEVSSHSLDQGRVEGLTFRVAIFTNLTRDHLDYHKTFDDYFRAKARLADCLAANGVEVVNADDSTWQKLRRGGHRRITFGEKGGDVTAHRITVDPGGSRFELVTPLGSAPVRLPLLGRFNVGNALGVAAAAWGMGLSVEEVAERLGRAPQVPGRMERIATQPCTVLRDYAHTPDALERALEALRPITPRRLLVVFGAGGDRDRGKRAPMGEIVSRLADLAIVTSDNPRTEDPERILNEVEEGMRGPVAQPHVREVDRRRAIAHALSVAREGDTLLLAGKGHETYQVVGNEKQPFDERRIIRELGAS